MIEREQAALLREIEERLLYPSVRQSRDQLSQLLADEFVEIGQSGRVRDKEGTIRALAGEQPVAASPQATSSWRCSIWRLIDHRWQTIFHQGTPIPLGSEP